MWVFVQVLLAHLLCGWAIGSELTFELPDNAKQCFYEDITIGTKCTLEFQVRLLVINNPFTLRVVDSGKELRQTIHVYLLFNVIVFQKSLEN